MMQMLHRGEIPALTDEIRIADTDNPRGYFEYERVKKTKQDATWLPEARGKAVKIISSLLYDLPDTERFRIIFMHRDIDEVLDSQEKMLQRLQRTMVPREELKASFSIHLQRLFKWIPTQSHLNLLEVNYNKLLEDPASEAQRIACFLDGVPSTSQMLEAIDPRLYRNRNQGT